MEKNTRNGIIVASIAIVGVYFAYKKFVLPDSKKVVLNYLNATFGGDHSSFVNSATKSYLDAWSKALMNGEDTFVDAGVTHWTCGGTSKQNDNHPCG